MGTGMGREPAMRGRQRCWCWTPPAELHRSTPPQVPPFLHPPLQQPHPGGTSWHPGCQPCTSGPSSEAAAGPTYATNLVGEPRPLGTGASGEVFPSVPREGFPKSPEKVPAAEPWPQRASSQSDDARLHLCSAPWPLGLDPNQLPHPASSQTLLAGWGTQAETDTPGDESLK